MLKHISEILGKFTLKQRVIVLCLLLLSIVIVSIGPTLIKTLKPDNKILKERINIQDSLISKLNIEIFELNNKLITTQQDCTDRVLKREREIIQEIEELENMLSNQPQPVSNKMIMADPHTDDTIVVRSVIPIDNEPFEYDNNNKTLKILEKLKQNIKKPH